MARKKRIRKQSKIKINNPVLSDVWIKNTKEVADLRQKILEENGGLCEMTHEVIERPTLDHCHKTGKVRGVISQHNNTMEGYVLKYYFKYVAHKTQLSISEWLRKLADYYDADFKRGLHFRTIHDAQVKLSRMKKEVIVDLLYSNFKVQADVNSTKADLIELYIINLISFLEGA